MVQACTTFGRALIPLVVVGQVDYNLCAKGRRTEKAVVFEVCLGYFWDH